MWDRFEPRDNRDGGSAWDRSLGNRGSTSDRNWSDECDPRDVFTKDLDLHEGASAGRFRTRPRLRDRRHREPHARDHWCVPGRHRERSTRRAIYTTCATIPIVRAGALTSRARGTDSDEPAQFRRPRVVLTECGGDLLEANRYERHGRAH